MEDEHILKILVTGANGYLGMGVVKQLIRDGILDVIATGRQKVFVDPSVSVQYISADLFSISDPYDYYNQPDILLHFAWEDGFKHGSNKHIDRLPDHYHFIEKMIKGGVRQCCIMGSVHEIGFYEGSVNESTAPFPQSLYGISKNALRDIVQLLCKENSVIFQWLRGYYIVGNPSYGCSVFSKIYEAAKVGKKTFPFTHGINQFDFIIYDDFCKQVSRTVEQREVNGIINICSGRPEKLADRVERFIKDEKLDIKLDYGAFPDRDYDSKAIWGNPDKINMIMKASEECVGKTSLDDWVIKKNKGKCYRIICVVPLYNPQKSELANIASYINTLDYCILMDDSLEEHKTDCEDLLTQFKGRVEYIWNGENIGLCKSANNGIERAKDLGAKWILIMNPDSKPQNDMVSVFRRYIDKNDTENVAILAPQYNYDRHSRTTSTGNKRIRFSNMSGSLINVKILNIIGNYDERFFIDGLDSEWCLRALKAGYEIIECSEAILDHHPAETKELKVFGRTVFRYGWDKPERYYYQFRGFMLIHKEYRSFFNDLFCIYKYLKALILFEDRTEYKKMWMEAKEDCKRGYFGNYKDRNGK